MALASRTPEALNICIAKGTGTVEHESGRERSRQIRKHVRARYFDAARHDGSDTVTIRAGDVARELRLGNRVPAICSALESKLLLDQAGLRAGGTQRSPPEHHDGVPLCIFRRMCGEQHRSGRGEPPCSCIPAVCEQRAAGGGTASGVRGTKPALPGLVRQDETPYPCGCEGTLCVPVVP